jgi:hypothetical protein
MNPILAGVLIGMGVGAAKNILVDQPREKKQRKLAAEVTRYSPWTGHEAQPVKPASMFESMLGYGGTGAMIGSSVGANAATPTTTPGSLNYGLTNMAPAGQPASALGYQSSMPTAALLPSAQQAQYNLLTPAQTSLGYNPNKWEQLSTLLNR